MLAQRISTVNGVAQVNVYGAQKYAVRIQLDRGAPRGALDRHRRGRDGDLRRQRQPARRERSRARQRALTVQTNGQLVNARRTIGRSWSPTGTARPCGSARSRTSSTAWRTTGRRRGSRDTRAIVLADPAPAGHRTRSRSSTRSRRCCPAFRAADSRRRCSSTSCTTGPSRSASPCADVQFTLGAHASAWSILVIFLFLRNCRATAHPEPRAADVDRRHVRGDGRSSATASTTCRSWR